MMTLSEYQPLSQDNRQSVYAILLTMVASVTGLALLIRRRWQQAPVEVDSAVMQTPADTAFIPVEQPSPSKKIPRVAARQVSQPRARSVTAVIGLALVGYGFLTGAQSLMLGSRNPLIPALGFLVGFVLLNPLYSHYERQWRAENAAESPADIAIYTMRNRFLYWITGLFFMVVTLVLAQLGSVSFILIFCWLMGVFAFSRLLLNGQPLLTRAMIAKGAKILRDNRQIALIVGGLSLVALALPLSTANIHSDCALRLINMAAIVALVPLTFLLGREWGDQWTGLVAAGFSAVSLWALALSKQDGLYTLLALAGGMYVLALLIFIRTHNRRAIILAGVALAAGGLLNMLLWLAFPLLPLAALIEERHRPGHTRWSQMTRVTAACLFVIVLIAPALNAAQLNTLLADNPSDDIALLNQLQPTPPPRANALRVANPQLSWLEGLSNSVLLFNLTSDPNPLHGVVNRPVLSPAISAALLLGLLGLGWRFYVRQRWQEAVIVIALVLLLVPAGYSQQLPVRYPNLLLAAPALPLVMVIAANGLALPLRLITARSEKTGLWIVVVIVVVILLSAFVDAQAHYQTIFYPLAQSIKDIN